MMTVKHITLAGEEFVYPTTHVNLVPASAKPCAPANSSLWRYDLDGRSHEIVSGSVYVMNEHGRTVARYALEDVQGIIFVAGDREKVECGSTAISGL